MKLPIIRSGLHLNKVTFVHAVGAFTAAFGGYYLFSKPEVIDFVVEAIDNIVVFPVKNYVFTPLEKGVNAFRFGLSTVGETLREWTYSYVDEFNANRVEWEGKGFIDNTISGGKKVFGTIREWIHSFAGFLFGSLIPFAQEHNVHEIIEYMKSYLKPLKQMWYRPENGRLLSDRTRIQQLLDAYKTPGFFDSLYEMNKFFLEFREQLKTLSDEQMAELVDTYLEDPIEMRKKVVMVMQYINKDKSAKEKFDVDLMMDFIRGENIDAIKARFAANAVASGVSDFVGSLTEIFSSFGADAEDAKTKTNEFLDKKLTEAFTSIVSWWHNGTKKT